MDELIGNLKTYEMKRKKDSERKEPKKERTWYSKLKAVTQALVAWGDSSSESEREPDAENNSMIAVETEATNLDNDKEILTLELGETEQSRDDLVVCVVDLNETITNLEKEKETLNEMINSVENERHDLMVVSVELKETIEGLNNEKYTLEEKNSATQQERDDFLVIINDLEETIEELNREHRTGSLGKGKEQLQAELVKVKIDLEKSLKWTWSSDAVTAMYLNNSGNR
ncbi:GRIP domain-containing protein RUD3-like [Nicotiana sylvestris]|uniref:GRIP domain-containing protein RUD3-like n=1 Tax=Nicotiana sylvestris TaxID=4096 RepID=UPI00388C8FC5